MRNDRTIQVLLAAIAFLLGANLLINLHQDRPAVAAGIPDAGAQAQAQLDQLTEINKKLDHLDGFLESGKLSVIVTQMPETKKP